MGNGNMTAVMEMVDENNEHMGKAQTSVIYHNRRLYACEESDKPWVISLPNLETVQRYDYNGALTHEHTAHPKICSVTGEMMMFGHAPKPKNPYVNYTVVSQDGHIESTLEIPLRNATFMVRL
jgi:carotenoid cleavage dioxygenase